MSDRSLSAGQTTPTLTYKPINLVLIGISGTPDCFFNHADCTFQSLLSFLGLIINTAIPWKWGHDGKMDYLLFWKKIMYFQVVKCLEYCIPMGRSYLSEEKVES